jgi:tight adherence protein C
VATIAYIIAAMLGASAFLFAISLIPSKSAITLRLEQMEAMRFTPEAGTRAAAFERVFNEKQRTKLQSLLLEAGWYEVTADKMGMRVIAGMIFGSAIAIGFGTYLEWYDEYLVLGTVALGFSGAILPYSSLRAAIRKRKTAVQRALPDLLDMLATTMHAGLAFNAALNYATEAARGPLGEELNAVLSEIRLGRSRAAALRSLSGRLRVPEISTMVTAVVQAERLGSNLAQVLEELAEDTRNKRMVRAEEVASMMPIKMVIPMALFMLPALFVMIFGGVIAQFLSK